MWKQVGPISSVAFATWPNPIGCQCSIVYTADKISPQPLPYYDIIYTKVKYSSKLSPHLGLISSVVFGLQLIMLVSEQRESSSVKEAALDKADFNVRKHRYS